MAEKAKPEDVTLTPVGKVQIQLYASGRSGIAQDHNRLAEFLSGGLGDLRSKWEMDRTTSIVQDTVQPRESPVSPVRDIFLVQVCQDFSSPYNAEW